MTALSKRDLTLLTDAIVLKRETLQALYGEEAVERVHAYLALTRDATPPFEPVHLVSDPSVQDLARFEEALTEIETRPIGLGDPQWATQRARIALNG